MAALGARAATRAHSAHRRVLNVLQEDDPEWVARRAVLFEQALRILGWTAGTNLRIDYRWTGSDPALAATSRVPAR